MKYVAAFDVGGTSIKSALVDEGLNVISTSTVSTPPSDTTGVKTVEAINAIAQKFSIEQEISALGLVVPGALDEPHGRSRWTGNLQWKDLPIRDLLVEKTHLPVAFGHDVRAGGLAELHAGAAKGFANAIFIPIGTGIAAALIIDGAIRAVDGFAGEIGHLDVGGAHTCVCGRKGCLEAVASALALSNAYENLTGHTGISAETILELVGSGDPSAQQVWADATEALSRVCEMLITILSPEIIVFGGGLSLAGPLLLDPIKKKLKETLTFQRFPEIEIAKFGVQAGTIGCAMLAFDLIGADHK